jgi:hypothetical protein
VLSAVNETRRRDVGLVFILSFLVFAYFMPQWADWNIDSRLDLVHAIVDGHTLQIDRYHYNTWDKAVYRGHYYSDKAPGTALLGVPVYALFVLARQTPVLGGGIAMLERNSAWNIAIALGRSSTQSDPGPKGVTLGGCQRAGSSNVQVIPWGNRLYRPMTDWALSKYVITVAVVGLLSAAFTAFFFWFLGWFALGMAARWLAVTLYALGTVALPYSSNFYSHQLAAAMLFTAFALVYLRSRGHARRWAVCVAGFLLGFALLTEYTVAIIVVVLVLYVLLRLRDDLSGVGLGAICGVVPIAALCAYNAACFGNPFDTGYSHDFCWSPAQTQGIAGFSYPHLDALYDLTFGPYRGLFFQSPFLLLAALGAILLWKRGARLESACCVIIAVGFILAISAYWGWNGGRVDGPRYLVPAVPFLAWPVALALPVLLRTVGGRVLVAVLSAWSFLATWSLFLGGLTFPTSWLRNPWLQFSLPALGHGIITPNAGAFAGLSGWASLLPLVFLVAAVLVILRLRPLDQVPIGRD